MSDGWPVGPRVRHAFINKANSPTVRPWQWALGGGGGGGGSGGDVGSGHGIS